MKNESYERPTVETVPASHILELLGPVSCGSAGNHDLVNPTGSELMTPGNKRLGRN